MATKGSSEVIKTPAQQDAIRRAAKANRKHHKRDFRPTETLAEGIAADRLQQRGRMMFEILELTMCSNKPDLSDQLKFALISYIENFIDIDWCRDKSPVQRHNQAMEIACGGLHPSVLGYAKRQFKDAFRATRPSR